MSLYTLKTSDQLQYGPVERETLRAWTREGRIKENDSIYDHTLLKWFEACKTTQIQDLFHAETPDAFQPQTISPQARDPAAKAGAGTASGEASKKATGEAIPGKPVGSEHLTPRSLSSSARLKIQKTMTQGDQAAVTDSQGQSSAVRPPTVLERISRIFLRPFVGKKPDKN